MRHSCFSIILVMCVSLAACSGGRNEVPFGSRGDRYCEILLVNMNGLDLEAKVWGTQGVSYCPAASWEALDADAIKTETGALLVVMNGPRYWMPSSTAGSLSLAERRTFGDLEMNFLATVEISPGMNESSSYTENTVQRTTIYTFNSGVEIYELTAPGGGVYVMQSMSQMVDPNLTLGDLPALGSRLEMPAGWSYSARTLTSDLVMDAAGTATVVQDNLKNSYQKR